LGLDPFHGASLAASHGEDQMPWICRHSL